jgi:hypothetical protein
MRLVLLLLVGSYASHVSVLQDLGVIVAAKDEVFSLPLFDYFAGPDLTFQVEGVESLRSADPYSFTMLTNFTYPTPQSAGVLQAPNLKLKTLQRDGQQYVFSYYGNNLALTIQTSEALGSVWNLTVGEALDTPAIVDVAVLPSGACLVVAVNALSGGLPVNTLFSVDISNLSKPGVPVPLSLPELQGLTGVLMAVSDSYLVVIGTTFTSLSKVGHLIVYKTPSTPSLLSTISRYSFTGSFSPVDAQFLSQDTFIVTDSSYGLVLYNASDDRVEETRAMPLAEYGTPTCFDYQSSTGVVGLNNATVVIDLDSWSIKALHPLWQLDASSPSTAANIELQDGFVFINSVSDVNKNLALVDLDLSPAQSLVRNWAMQDYFKSYFNPYAPYAVFSNQDGSYSYVRSDFNSLHLIQLTVGAWELIGSPSTTAFQANVTASNRLVPSYTASSTITVQCIQANDSSIVAVTGLRYTPEPIEIEQDMKGVESYSSILYVSPYFEGPNLNFSLTWTSSPQFVLTSEIVDDTSALCLDCQLTTDNIIGVEDAVLSLSSSLTVITVDPSQVLSSPSFNLPGDVAPSLAVSYDGRLYVYSSKSGKVYGYSGYLDRPAYFGEWELSVPCTGLKRYKSNLLCGSASALQILQIQSGNLTSLFELNATTAGLRAELEIIDFSFGSAQFEEFSKDFGYILDANLGLVYFRLDLITASTTTVPLSSFFASNMSHRQEGRTLLDNGQDGACSEGNQGKLAGDTISLCSTGDQILTVHLSGIIEVFSILYSTAPSLNRTIVTGSAVEYSVCTLDYLAVQQNDFLNWIDPYASTASALFKSTPNPKANKAVAVESKLLQLARIADNDIGSEKTIQVITSRRSRTAPAQPLSLWTYVFVYIVRATGINQPVYEFPGNLTASNAKDSLSLQMRLRIYNNGQVIFVNDDFPSEAFELSYNSTTSINLESIFYGQDVKLYLNINGQYPTLSYHQFNNDPAVLWPQLELTDHAETNSTNLFYDMAVLSSEKLLLVTSAEAVLMFSLKDQPDTWEDIPQAEVFAQLNYTQYLNSSASCYDIETGDHVQDMLTFYTACRYAQPNSIITQSSLVKWLYNLPNKAVVSVESTDSPFFLSRLKAVQTEAETIVLGIDNPQRLANQTYSNNHLLWTSDSAIYSADFFSLGLDTFYASAVDTFAIVENEMFVYVADSQFGLRVLELQGSSISLVYNVEFPSNTLVSLGVCDSMLYAGDSLGSVFKFSLQDPKKPSLVAEFFKADQFVGLQGAIQCSAQFDPQYVAVPLLSASGNFTIRLFDLFAVNISAIFYDVPMTGLPDTEFSGAALFLDFNSLTGLSQLKMQNFQLREPYLELQSMTEAQYAAMIEKWGMSKFQIKVVAINDHFALNSSSLFVSRTAPTHHDSDDDDSDDNDSLAWWAWFLIAIAILIVLGLVAFAVFYFYRERKRREAALLAQYDNRELRAN